jgi:Zn-dependent peptidase ImmA (M78 family)
MTVGANVGMEARLDFARRMAHKYLRKHQVAAPPVPVEYLLVQEGILVEVLTYPDDTAGESWWEDGIGHIAVNRALQPGRLRFTLAHEFGHLVLRHHERRFTDLSAVRQSLRDPEEMAWEPVDPVEVEANAFAAELLMPVTLFHADWKRNPSIGRLARRYEVSVEAVAWRIRRLLPREEG